MNAITEIDKAGRIVVPKKMRDSLHLVPGMQVSIRVEGDGVVIEPQRKPRGLYMEKGTLVYDSGPGPETDVVEWIAEDREARMKHLAGSGPQK